MQIAREKSAYLQKSVVDDTFRGKSNMSTFGKRLNKAIKESGYTKKDIAESIGINRTTLTRISKDENDPGLSVVRAIAQMIDVDLNWLITGEEFEKASNKELKAMGLPKNETMQELFTGFVNLSKSRQKDIIRLINLYLEEESE